MDIVNSFNFIGVVNEEPKLMKLSDGQVMARTIVKIPQRYNGEGETVIPVTAFNKKAHVLCALAHRGSTIYAKSVVLSAVNTTSIQAKTLIAMTVKIIDFVVLKKEQLDFDDIDYVDVLQMYEPEVFMEIGEEIENVE